MAAIYLVENSKIISVSSGDVSSSDPSSPINRAQEWAAEKAGRSVFINARKVDAPLQFLKIEGGNLRVMDAAEKKVILDAEKQAQDDEKSARKNRKRQLLQDLNIPAGKKAAFIQGLKELLADGHDD